MSAIGDMFHSIGSTSFAADMHACEIKDWKERPQRVRARQHAVACSAPMDGLVHEQMVQLVQRVFLTPAIAPRKVMFCGTNKSNSDAICANAGRVLAEQTGATVCLVDANMQDYCLSNQFDLDHTKSTFGQKAQWRERCFSVGNNLFVAGAGVLGTGQGKLSPSNEMRNRIAALASSFQYLLFDAAGVNTSADTALLGQLAGSAVLVLEAGSTRKVEAKKAMERLELANVHVVGAVLKNKRS